MTEDPIRGRFREVSTDVVVMPLLAGISTLIATHHIMSTPTVHALYPTGLTVGAFTRWCSFGLISHFAFSFSLLYRHRSKSMLVLSLLRSCALTTYMFAFYLVRSHRPISYFTALGTFFALTFFYQTVRYQLHFSHLVRHRESVLILGTGREAQKTWRHIRIHCDQLVEFKGFVAESASRDAAPDILARTVCTIDSLERFVHRTAVDTFVLTATGPEDAAFAEAARQIAKESGSRLLSARQPSKRLQLLHWFHLDGDGYVESEQPSVSTKVTQTLKAFADRVLAGSVLLLLMPVTVPLFLLYQALLGEFPLMRQVAYGYRRRPFTMWDLRIVASKQRLSYDDARMRTRRYAIACAKLVSRVGHFLCISGLARAPRMWNVLVGDMSLVGPKPVLQTQVLLGDSTVLLRRYTMRPGLCWPKPEGGQTEEEATRSYLDDWSLSLDWRTFTHWVRSRAHRTLFAISAPLLADHATLTEPTQRP